MTKIFDALGRQPITRRRILESASLASLSALVPSTFAGTGGGNIAGVFSELDATRAGGIDLYLEKKRTVDRR